jgi:hypothetical protein
MFAYFVWRLVDRWVKKDGRKIVVLALTTGLCLLVNAEAATWGGWVLNCTPEEYASADWINKNTKKDDIIIANWYTGDYLRSLTLRNIVISDYPRVEVRVAMDKFNLNIPILPRDPKKVLEYVQSHPGNYYLVTSKWGPWGKYEANPQFELLRTNGSNKKTQSKIFKIHPESAESIPETF